MNSVFYISLTSEYHKIDKISIHKAKYLKPQPRVFNGSTSTLPFLTTTPTAPNMQERRTVIIELRGHVGELKPTQEMIEKSVLTIEFNCILRIGFLEILRVITKVPYCLQYVKRSARFPENTMRRPQIPPSDNIN